MFYSSLVCTNVLTAPIIQINWFTRYDVNVLDRCEQYNVFNFWDTYAKKHIAESSNSMNVNWFALRSAPYFFIFLNAFAATRTKIKVPSASNGTKKKSLYTLSSVPGTHICMYELGPRFWKLADQMCVSRQQVLARFIMILTVLLRDDYTGQCGHDPPSYEESNC